MATIVLSKRLSALHSIAATDMEKVFADIVTGGLGGAWYLNGAAQTPAAGTLSAANFRVRAGIGNAYKTSPYSYNTIQFHCPAAGVGTTSLYYQVHGLLRPEAELVTSFWAAGVDAINGTGSIDGTAKLYRWTGTTWVQVGNTSTFATGAPRTVLFSDSSVADVTIRRGNILRVDYLINDFNGGTATSAQRTCFSLLVKSKHIA